MDAVRVADDVDPDDPAARDSEGHDRERLPAAGGQRPDRAVDQGGAQFATARGVGLLGHRRRAADDGCRPGGAEVGAQDDVGVEDLDEGVEVAGPRGRVEGADDLPLARQIRIG